MEEVKSSNWEEKVISSSKPTLVDFWAEWCGPCKTVSPILEELSQEYSDKANFVKINVDKNKDVAQKYNIQSIPTIALFKNGKIVNEKSGINNKNTLVEMLKNT